MGFKIYGLALVARPSLSIIKFLSGLDYIKVVLANYGRFDEICFTADEGATIS
jgi:hypothetical protein